MFVRVGHSILVRMVRTKACKASSSVRGHWDCNTVGCAVSHSGHGSLAYCSSTCEFLTLGLRHMGPNPTEVGLVCINRSCEGFLSPHASRMRWSMNHAVFCVTPMSRCLHAGHAYEAGHFHVDGRNPLPERDLGSLQCRPDPDRECLLATGAVVRQSGRLGGLTRVRASAPRAMATVRPYQGFKPCRSGVLIGEHGGQLHERER